MMDTKKLLCKEGFIATPQGTCVSAARPVSVTRPVSPSSLQQIQTQIREAFAVLRIKVGISKKEAEIAGAIVEGIAGGDTEYVDEALSMVDESRFGVLAQYLKGAKDIDKERARKPSELAALNKAISLLESMKPAGSNTTTYLLIGGGLVVAYLLFK